MSLEEQQFIRSKVDKQTNKTKTNKQTNRRQTDKQEEWDINQYLRSEIEEIKRNRDKQLAVKDKQLENKDLQINQLQNLLDQQQRLALQDKKLLEEYKVENDRLKALKIPSQETKEELVDNQSQEVTNVVEATTEVPRKWWQFWR